MPRYAVAGTPVDVDLDLPELEPDARTAGEPWAVRRVEALPEEPRRLVTEVRTPSGDLFGTVEAAPASYWVSYPGRAEFRIAPSDRTVTYTVAAGTAPVTVRHLLVDQVLPYVLVADGAFVLHAACVGIDGRAVAFVGPSGAGKSSLAASFVEAGAALLTDDFVVLSEAGDGYLAAGAYPGLRLWEDSAARFAGPPDELPRVAEYSDKRRWAVPEVAPAGSLPLAALVVPGSVPEAGRPDCLIGRIRGVDAFTLVCEQGFRLERSEREALSADFERVARLVERVPLFLVEYRRDYALLPEVRAAVLRAVSEVDRTGSRPG